MAEKEELFKTTWKGGYDKDDVLQEYQKLTDDVYEEQHRFQKGIESMDRDITEKTAKIAELEARMEKCDAELAELQGNVRDNFQPYIDSYDAIGSQIFESRVYADGVAKEAQEERTKLLEEAMEEARQIRDDAMTEAGRVREEARADAERLIADARLQNERQSEIGRQKYEAVQQELHMVLGDFSQVQRKFMSAYKSIHDVLNDETGDVARMRLDILQSESPTIRIPNVADYLREHGMAAEESEIDTSPTKNLREVQEALADADSES